MADQIIGGFKFRGGFAKEPEEYPKRDGEVKHLVVHCSATKATADIGVDQIRKWHTEDNGWLDTGYHFVIRRDGTIERGRPHWAIGAGVAGYNSHSLHICLVGGIDNDGRAEDNFRPVQKAALAFLLALLLKSVAPTAKVCGHRDFPGVKKDCPSFDAIKWWSGPKAETKVEGVVFQQVTRGDVYLN
jgi:N-acetyl-anhydromuramyl-L-alanine amidase AmpD